MPDPVSHSLSRARSLLQPLKQFLQVEAASGIALLIATVIALIWANSGWSAAYHALWHAPVSFGFGELVSTQPLHFWINDGLMTIFFLLVGLEIRREMVDGTLATWRLAVLPICAALGGVAAPALIFLALNSDPVLRQAWAVPTATDIAFAVGVLALLGKRIPPQLRILLLAIAIIDDVAAILIIAIFYSSGIQPLGLAMAAAGVLLVPAMHRMNIGSATAYILPGFITWSGLLYAGVHPTLAGVIMGLLTPLRPRGTREHLLAHADSALREFETLTESKSAAAHRLALPLRRLKLAQREMLAPLVRVEMALHPWVAYAIVPLFALANAGVDLRGAATAFEADARLMLGVVLGLVIGKPVGIGFATWLALRVQLGRLPPQLSARGVLLVGLLAGIGFTMSIFIANLAFTDAALLDATKLSVLLGSFCAAVLGLAAGALLLRAPPHTSAA